LIAKSVRIAFMLLALTLVLSADLNAQGVCLVTTPDWNCSSDFNTKPPKYCSSAGQLCTDGLCPGESWQIENASDWSTKRIKAVLAMTGEAGVTGTTKDYMCTWKQQCFCRYDPTDPPGWKRCAKSSKKVAVQSITEYVPPEGGGGACVGIGGE
jgi:hypothetical protein